MKNIKDNEKAMKYNDVVIDKTTGLVALKMFVLILMKNIMYIMYLIILN